MVFTVKPHLQTGIKVLSWSWFYPVFSFSPAHLLFRSQTWTPLSFVFRICPLLQSHLPLALKELHKHSEKTPLTCQTVSDVCRWALTSLCALKSIKTGWGQPGLELLAQGLEHRKQLLCVNERVSERISEWVNTWMKGEEWIPLRTHSHRITSRHSRYTELNSPHMSRNVLTPLLSESPKENTLIYVHVEG